MKTVTTTRLLVDEDIPEVVELMRLSLGEPALLQRTKALFRWKHLDNPFGRSIALVAVADGQIVGLRTFMRWMLLTKDGNQLSCIRAVDTATHPEHQRKGIFRRLTEEGVEIAEAEGVDLIFNTPNEKSRPGYLKMGWQDVGGIGAMVRPSTSMLRRRDKTIDFTPDLRIAGRVSGMDLEDRKPLGLRTPRTQQYLAWRFEAHPSATYFVTDSGGGRAVLRPNRRKGRREMVVADLFGDPRVALREAVRAKGDAYSATFFSKGPERTEAIRRGYVPVPGYKALTLVARPLRDLPAGLLDISAWDVAVSDFELL